MKILIIDKNRLFKWLVTQVVLLTFLSSSVASVPFVHAQSVAGLPTPGTLVALSPTFNPTIIKGITIHPTDPFLFDFIVHPGDNNLQGEDFQKESMKLIKYFMAALTVPEDEMWVNLSPYEKDRIVPEGFGDTEMGRDLLAQDYMLKQLTASLMNPDDKLGNNFWKRVYQRAYEEYGTTEIPMNTFNKVWIVPEKAIVYENGKHIFVVESRLKVMLEEDYLALVANAGNTKHGLGNVSEDELTELSEVSSKVIREIIIPEIEKEVNEGKTFANLRQISNSVILATWYKQNIQKSMLERVYVNKNKTNGIDTEDKEVNRKIYDQYVKAFEKGVYNFIKEDYDETTQALIPRKYFAGGVNLDNAMLSKGQKPNAEFLEGTQGLRVRLSSSLQGDRAMGIVLDSAYVTNPDNFIGSGGEGKVFRHPTDSTKVIKVITTIYLKNDLADRHIQAYERLYKALKQDKWLRDRIVDMEFSKISYLGEETWAIITPFDSNISLSSIIREDVSFRELDADVKELLYGAVDDLKDEANEINRKIDEISEEMFGFKVADYLFPQDGAQSVQIENVHVNVDFETGRIRLRNIDPINISYVIARLDKDLRAQRDQEIEAIRREGGLVGAEFLDSVKNLSVHHYTGQLSIGDKPLKVLLSSGDFYESIVMQHPSDQKKMISIGSSYSNLIDSRIAEFKELERLQVIPKIYGWGKVPDSRHEFLIMEKVNVSRLPTVRKVLGGDVNYAQNIKSWNQEDLRLVGELFTKLIRAGYSTDFISPVSIMIGYTPQSNKRQAYLMRLDSVEKVKSNTGFMVQGQRDIVYVASTFFYAMRGGSRSNPPKDFVDWDEVDPEGYLASIFREIMDSGGNISLDVGDQAILAEKPVEVVASRITDINSQQNPGGIDLNPNIMDMETQGRKEKFVFNFDSRNDMSTDIDGLIPVIINVAPIINIPMLLGENENEEVKQLSQL